MRKEASKKTASIVSVFLCMFLCVGFSGCFGKVSKEVRLDNDIESDYISDELVGMFETETEAQEAAELYGLDLVSYENQIAVFKCDGDPKDYIEAGEANGWPPLSLNYIYKISGEEIKEKNKNARFNNR